MAELRLLTDAAKRTRFDFVWQMDGCRVPLLEQQECEQALRLALDMMIYKWRFGLGRL